MSEEIEEKNLFMMCNSLNKEAVSDIPNGYHIRLCQEDELDIWKAMQFDTDEEAREYHDFMTDYYNQVYLRKGNLFFSRCLFICDQENTPIGTCFLWKAYDAIWTLHWFKVKKEYEGKGIGRALLSYVMASLPEEEYPIYLHTHPESIRALKLYSDFGFKLITDPFIGNRRNHLNECIPILETQMVNTDFKRLQFTPATAHFLKVSSASNIEEF